MLSFKKYFLSDPEYLIDKFLAKKCTTVALYGAGKFGIEVYVKLRKRGIEVVSWFDKRADSEGVTVLGQQILPPSEAQNFSDVVDCILICSGVYVVDIKRYCYEGGFSSEQVVSIDD